MKTIKLELGLVVKVQTPAGIVDGTITSIYNDRSFNVLFNYEGSGLKSIDAKFSKKTGKIFNPAPFNKHLEKLLRSHTVLYMTTKRQSSHPATRNYGITPII